MQRFTNGFELKPL